MRQKDTKKKGLFNYKKIIIKIIIIIIIIIIKVIQYYNKIRSYFKIFTKKKQDCSKETRSDNRKVQISEVRPTVKENEMI